MEKIYVIKNSDGYWVVFKSDLGEAMVSVNKIIASDDIKKIIRSVCGAKIKK